MASMTRIDQIHGGSTCLRRGLCVFIMLLAALFSDQPVFGDSRESDNVSTADTTEATYRLEEVIIVGNRSRFLQPDIAVLDAEQIAEKKAVSAADVLRLDPSLSVTSGAKSETETRLRGFAAEQLLVLVDGRPVNPGNYGKVDLAMLPVENIAKVKVIKGPASVVYGPNSMGGVLNIITKNGREKPQTVIAAEFGDLEFRQLSLNHTRSLGNWNYWLSLHENHSKGFELSEDFGATSLEKGGVRENSGYHKIGFDSKLGYTRSENELYALSVGYHWAKKSVPPTIYSWDSPSYRKFPSYERLNTAFSGTRQFTDAFELKTLVFIDAYHDRLIDYLDAEMSDDRINWDSKIENWTVGGSLDGTIEASKIHTVRCGLMLKRDLMNKKPDLDDPWETAYQYVGNLYAEDRIEASKSTEVTLGLGYAILGTEAESFSVGEFTPSLSAFQKLPRDFQLSGGYSHAMHFATIHQLYGETSGNPDLKPEQADKWEVSLARKCFADNSNRSLTVQASYFYNDLQNLIYRSSRSDRYENIGSTTLEGVELSAELSVASFLQASIGFVRINPERTSSVMLEDLSPNRFHGSVTVQAKFGLRVIYDMSTFDNRKTFAEGFTLYPYELHNLTVSQRIHESLTVYAKAQNLTDVDYQEELGYPGPGRQITGGLRYKI